jgi:Peptidase family M28
MAWRNLPVVVVLAVGFALTLGHARGPEPRPASAAGNVFSAGRAAGILADLTGDGVPHPVGSTAHAAVRDRIVQRLRRLGYQPEVEAGFACSTMAVCAGVENITAVVPGSADGPAVMLAAHYDSVAAGPGASDDGAGVAVLLEISRVLAAEPLRRNPVVLLFDDAEEAGLVGAESFVSQSPWASRVAVVVNVEARGTRGESFMFETTPGHRWLIDLMARNVERPDSGSIFYEIYKRLPNDTDFTVFKRAGKEGLNFAWLGDVSDYHTPLDDLRHTSRRSLQHQGDNVLAVARALAAADLEHRERGDLVWFDLLSLCLIRWPVAWSVPLAVGALLIAATAILIGRRRDRGSVRLAVSGVLWFASSLVINAAGVIVALVLVKLRSGDVAWPAHPGGAIGAAWMIGLLAPIGLAGWFKTRAAEYGLAAGAALGWSALAVSTAWFLPGASYLFLPVAFLLSLSSLSEISQFAVTSSVLRWAAIALSVAMLFPFAWTLYDAVGLLALIASSLLVGLVSTTWCGVVASWPQRARATVLALLFVLIVLSAGTAMLQPVYSPSSPQRMNIVLQVDADQYNALWLTSVRRNDLPPQMSHMARWSQSRPFPWYANALYSSSRTPMLSLAPPQVDVVSERAGVGTRRLRLWLHSGRGANTIILNVHDRGRLQTARVGGWLLTPFSGRYRRWLTPGWTRLVVRGRADVDLDLVFRGSEPIEAVIEDQSYGLPASAARLSAARGPSAVPSDSGDLTIVTHAIKF